MSIELKLKSGTIWSSITVSIIAVIISSTGLYKAIDELNLVKNESKKNQSLIELSEKQFFFLTDKLISSDDSLVINIESIKKIFNSVDRKYNGILFKYGFINVLEDYSVKLISDSSNINKKGFKTITALIKEEIKGEPFNQLKPEQKRVLLNLKKSINSNDKDISDYNLNELNDIFRVQNETIIDLEKQNNWSIPLAIAGLVLTLIFGVLSLIKTISKKVTEN